MNRESYLTLLLAVCCIGAAGVSATTLDSTVSQTPDDVIDVDFSKLPIGEDEGASVKGAVQSESGRQAQTGSGEEGSPRNPADSDSSEGEESDSASSDDPGSGASKEVGGETGEGAGGSGGEESAGSSRSSGTGLGPGSGTQPLSLLLWILALLRRLLPLLVVLAAAALLYRYRRHLIALGMAVVAVLGGADDERSASTSEWPSDRPDNDVHRAWLSMVAETEIEEPRTRTPSQCAAAAVDANLDPSAVRTLTDVFEEVRYGERPVTDERRERARDSLQRLDGGESL